MLAEPSSARHLSAPQTLPVRGRRVRAGDLVAELRGHELTHLRFGPVELLSLASVAVRDAQWNTVPAQVIEQSIQVGGTGFAARLACAHAENRIHLDWEGMILGTADGQIELTMLATARRAFEYRRMGYCLLLACDDYAGRPYRALGPSGKLEGRLPVEIAPQLAEDGVEQPLFPAFSDLHIELASGPEIAFSFKGELFEMEDQRNWTDATFKVYGTPLSLGGPFRAHPGQRFSQQLRITLRGRRSSRRQNKSAELRIGPLLKLRMPGLGVGAPSDPGTRVAVPVGLGPAHLRVEFACGESSSAQELEAAATAARATGVGLEVAVVLPDESDDGLSLLVEVLRGLPLVRVLIFASGQPVTPSGLCGRLRARLRTAGVRDVGIAGGTNANFAELNRERPELRDADAVTWSINPQVHSSDDESLIETLGIQGQTVISAGTLYPRLPAIVSPVTLRPRFNHDMGHYHERAATEEERQRSCDPRQPTLFCAAWTVGSITRLALAGASSLTYFEAVGPRGLAPLDTENARVFPVFHVIAELAAWRGRPLIELPAPPGIAAIGSEQGPVRSLLVANLGAEARTIGVALGHDGPARIRCLNLATVGQAMTDPEAFAHTWDKLPASTTRIELGAYGVTWIRITPASAPPHQI
jgi:hypothetical protein